MAVNDCRKLAYEVAEKDGLKHVFNKDLMAGKNWYHNFVTRHPNLSLTQPVNTSMTWAKGFCRQNVNHLFDIFETICDENQLDATRIYNVDESGFSAVQKKCQKVIALKKKKKKKSAQLPVVRGVLTLPL
jgi:hypothetical protein